MVRDYEEEKTFSKAIKEDVLGLLNQHLASSEPSMLREDSPREEVPE